ncbi:hypothetical protein BRD00_05395 [Halobacteriales archaeon QS_8_69_26]|nr:MAG: hypothetical protein BRD00_05395 [Halobacteriales archaeon QS_8_69_26]
MFHEEVREQPGGSVEDLRREYAAWLADAVESAGVDAAAERTGLDRSTVAAVAAGEVGGLSLEEAGTLAALADGMPDGETVVEMACDHVLLGMSTGVLDVDTVASNVDLDLTPKEIQQKLERRAPMSFEEFVAIRHFVASRQGEAF